MPLILDVSPEVEERLLEVARQRGTDVSRYVCEVVLESAERDAASESLSLAEAARMLSRTPASVTRMLKNGDLASLHPATVLAEKRRLEAANRAMDEIVEISEELKLYDHQSQTK